MKHYLRFPISLLSFERGTRFLCCFIFLLCTLSFLYYHKSVRRHFVVQSQEGHMQRCFGTFLWHVSIKVKRGGG